MLATFKLVFVEVLNSSIFKEQLKELDIMLTIFKLVFVEVLNSFIFKEQFFYYDVYCIIQRYISEGRTNIKTYH